VLQREDVPFGVGEADLTEPVGTSDDPNEPTGVTPTHCAASRAARSSVNITEIPSSMHKQRHSCSPRWSEPSRCLG
jgi:hypothetical protein